MSKVDYDKVDQDLDDQLRAMYSPEPDEPQGEASPDTGTEAKPESETAPDTGTVVDDKETPEPEQEPTVPESRYKSAVVAMNQAQQELAQYRKNEADKDAYIAQLEQQARSTQNPSTQTGESDDADLDDVRENYPEIINPLLKKIAQLEKRLASVTDDVGTVKNVTNRYQQTEQETEAERHFATIKAQHGDLEQIVESPEYADWYNQQGPMIQQALQQGTAKDVIAALNLFRNDYPRASTSEAPQKSNGGSKLEAARNASSPNIRTASKPSSKIVFTNEQIAKMSPLEFKEHEAEIDRQLARGEIY
jgi:hypothetical protein